LFSNTAGSEKNITGKLKSSKELLVQLLDQTNLVKRVLALTQFALLVEQMHSKQKDEGIQFVSYLFKKMNKDTLHELWAYLKDRRHDEAWLNVLNELHVAIDGKKTGMLKKLFGSTLKRWPLLGYKDDSDTNKGSHRKN